MRSLMSVAAALSLAACGGAGSPGGDARRSFAVTGFDRVVLAGPDDVTVTTGPAFKVEAEADQAVLDEIEVAAADGELRIGRSQEERGWRTWLPKRRRAIVRVTMPTVRGVSVSGAGNAAVAAAAVPVFVGAVDGAGNLSLTGLDARNAAFTLSGAGNMDLAGKVGGLTVQLAGAGNVSAEALQARDVEVAVTGVGNVEARASGRAQIRMSGVGRVDVKGTDDCQVSTSGAGNVSCAK